MSDLQIRQGTVYREKSTGHQRLIINHNPMCLSSLMFSSPAPDAPFDAVHPEVISADVLIEMRRSGNWEDLGELPPETVIRFLEALLQAKVLPESEKPFVQAVVKDMGKYEI